MPLHTVGIYKHYMLMLMRCAGSYHVVYNAREHLAVVTSEERWLSQTRGQSFCQAYMYVCAWNLWYVYMHLVGHNNFNVTVCVLCTENKCTINNTFKEHASVMGANTHIFIAYVNIQHQCIRIVQWND